MSLYGNLISINESNTGKTYDKVKWHIDNGEDFDKVIRKFKSIFSFLDREKLLNKEGKEEYNDLSEDSILNSSMVTSIGKQFLDKYYDSKILPAEKTSSILTSCWNDFQKKKMRK